MLFIYERELWTLAKRSAMQIFITLFCIYAVSHINITLIHIIILYQFQFLLIVCRHVAIGVRGGAVAPPKFVLTPPKKIFEVVSNIV